MQTFPLSSVQRIEKIKELKQEYEQLKSKLFGNNVFVVLDEDAEDTKRYNQLFQFFFPVYRTKNFISPLF